MLDFCLFEFTRSSVTAQKHTLSANLSIVSQSLQYLAKMIGILLKVHQIVYMMKHLLGCVSLPKYIRLLYHSYLCRLTAQWYLFYNQEFLIRKQLVSQLEASLFSIPWGHHIMIMQRCKSIQEALFYVHKTIENHWSRSVLEHQIALNLYARQGKAITNFQLQLPATASDLAQELTKDPYVFDFLSMTEGYTERELQQYLEDHMTKFLLELGKGFCFYGKQVHINVGGMIFTLIYSSTTLIYTVM